MQKAFFVLFLFLMASVAVAQPGQINIVPKPNSIKPLGGSYKLGYKTKIYAADDLSRKFAAYLNDSLLKIYGFKLEVTAKPQKKNFILFDFNMPTLASDDASHRLSINKGGVKIAAPHEIGAFYGLQSFLQLIPADFKGKAEIPATDISDAPRFKYRGMHLDVSRHFFPVEFVKKYIDLMAMYKFNYFHWHLTEDQGWRIEIMKYPKLTEVGGFRKETVKERNLQPYIGDGIPYGGFYTQEQIKDVVAYAKSRYITVIPEIELPGHSSAALAAYPQLGCKENYEYKVQTTWGIFKEVYCPKEETFKFLEEVLTEVIDLFPDSPYIHIGGDEVLKDHWKESPLVQELKTRERLKDEHEVQSYFIRRMEKFINSKGKRIIGWDEILEGGLAPNAVVMSWRGEKGGIEAAKANHEVIMTPTDYCYFDYGQGDPKFEPLNIGGYVPLEKVYSYNPMPKELAPDQQKFILGAQANLWTEYLKTPERVEYMAFPRMLALAEVVWTAPEQKSYLDFLRRLGWQTGLLDKLNVAYRIPPPDGLKNMVIADNKPAVMQLTPAVGGAKIFYTTDGSEPNAASSLYSKSGIVLRPDYQQTDIKVKIQMPNGRFSSVYSATVLRGKMLEPTSVPDAKPGVRYSLFKGPFNSIADVNSSQLIEKSETKSLGLQQFAQKTGNLKESFGVIADGYILIPNDGVYEFQMDSTMFSIFWIDENELTSSDPSQNLQTKSMLLPLKKGLHAVHLVYFTKGGGARLTLRWNERGIPLRGINANDLYH